MRKFAIYLPQFHEIEDNNRWWGKGFTEWTNVKAAKPLYRGHMQPIHPLNNNYYDLTDPSTIERQIELAKKYGVDGFIYYHYYFEGKLIMEKPVESFLNNKNLHHSFFFCWANHTWYKGDSDQREVLIQQTYGAKDDWENHFQYLLPFFKDTRYEKKDGKPLFMIYVHSFEHKKEILSYFDYRCREEGFEGIYIIETYTGDASERDIKAFSDSLVKQSELIYFREPSVAMRKFLKDRPLTRLYFKMMRNAKINISEKHVLKVDGSTLFKYMQTKMVLSIANLPVSHGLYYSWDNTPRHGKKGYVISYPSKLEFDKYMFLIKDEEYLFINAWNEWAEGMIMEPTVEYGFCNLEWLTDASRKFLQK